jgi:ABC-type transporter Mla subunit MlaD
MYVDINPGTKSAGVLPDGGTIPISDTTSPTDSDELVDELDVDTRDWFTSLITELANGTSGRGSDIRRMLTTLGPTAQQTRQIADLLARRRTELASLVHNLGVLTKATSQDDGQLATLVDSGNRTIQALASQDVALRQAIRLLPGTLAQTRTTFGHLTSFADELGPTASKLIPVAQHLPATLRDTKTLIQTSALLPINKVKSFENAIVPLTGAVTGVTSGLQTDLPPLTTTFKALQYVTNEVAYAPSAGNPGFTYWLSWFAHNVNSFVGNHDANGSGWRSLLITSCGTLGSLNPALRTLLTTVLGNFGC